MFCPRNLDVPGAPPRSLAFGALSSCQIVRALDITQVASFMPKILLLAIGTMTAPNLSYPLHLHPRLLCATWRQSLNRTAGATIAWHQAAGRHQSSFSAKYWKTKRKQGEIWWRESGGLRRRKRSRSRSFESANVCSCQLSPGRVLCQSRDIERK